MNSTTFGSVESPRRRPRFRRHRFVKVPFVLQDRDREIVRLVAEYRVVTSAEIVALVGGSAQGILRRLQRLFHAGYLDRPIQQRQLGNQKFVYMLGDVGAHLLRATTELHVGVDRREQNRRARSIHLEHALMISRFHAALAIGAARSRIAVLERWKQDSELNTHVTVEHSDWRERIPVCPDAYFLLRLRDERESHNRVHVFLEADRGTMTTRRFGQKLTGYWHYWRQAKTEKSIGAKNFQVLTITRSLERARNLTEVAASVDTPRGRGLRMFLFGAESSYSIEDPTVVLGKVWASPNDPSLHSLLE